MSILEYVIREHFQQNPQGVVPNADCFSGLPKHLINFFWN